MEKVKFKYHPNVWELDVFDKNKDGTNETCQCCGIETEYYYTGMYTAEDVECICPGCIATGKAAEKFDGEFIQDADMQAVKDKSKIEELFKRTPGYISGQGEYWQSCCNDFCAFIGDVGVEELEELGILNEVVNDYERENHDSYYEDCKDSLGKGVLWGYLFKCLHCSKYKIWVDAT